MNNPTSEYRFGLIGHGIQGSLSPKLFAAAYCGLWPYDLLDEDSWEAAFKRFLEGPYHAVNVTAPYKLDALRVCASGEIPGSEVDPLALRIGGVNILVKRSDGSLYASNSDYWGVYNTLRSVVGSKAVIIGAGGAARAALVACEDMFKDVVIVSRSPREGLDVQPLNKLSEALKGASVVVYTLPCALDDMTPIYDLDSDVVLLEAGYAHRSVDPTIYKGIYIKGENWLLNQGVPAYRLMTGGAEPDAKAMARAIFGN